jgi:rod shape determining protein RodA
VSVAPLTPIRPAEQRSERRSLRSHLIFDPLLSLATLGLIACSYLTLRGPSPASAKHQVIYAAIGLVAAIIVSRFDYSRLREYRYLLYGLMLVLNLVVLGMPAIQGSHRWIPLPLFNFQSSEFGKLLLIVSLSAFAVQRGRQLHEKRTTVRLLLLALVPAVLVIPEPDIGTAIIYMGIVFLTLVFAGTPWKQLAALVALAAAGVAFVMVIAPAAGIHVLKPYQEQRLTAFLHSSGTCNTRTDQPCYQLHEALIALGSGEKTGRGVFGATQANLDFLPAASTDFVFDTLGETYGFVGAALVLSLYALLIWRTLRILTIAKNLYGTLVAGGILAMVMFQVFLNVGVAIGIMPVTGVPLPLMSYGGSSVVVTFLAFGLLQSIYRQARLAQAAKARLPAS